MKLGNEVQALRKRVAEKILPGEHFLERAEAQQPGEQSAVVKSVF